MSSSPRTLRVPAFVAAATVSALALAACSGGSDNAATSTPPATSTTSSATSTATPTSTSTAPATSTPPPTTTTTTPKPTATTPAPTTKFINACVTANSKLNSAVSQWNTAVASGNDNKLDAAATNFRTVGGILIGLRGEAWDRQFSLDVQAVATELNKMADARKNNQTVTTTAFNSKVTALRTYCQSRLKS